MTSEGRKRGWAILLFFVVSAGEAKGGSHERFMTYEEMNRGYAILLVCEVTFPLEVLIFLENKKQTLKVNTHLSKSFSSFLHCL